MLGRREEAEAHMGKYHQRSAKEDNRAPTSIAINEQVAKSFNQITLDRGSTVQPDRTSPCPPITGTDTDERYPELMAVRERAW